LIDPAAGIGNAGSSWSVLINNLFTNGPAMTAATIGHWFYFPIFIAAGTAIGARVQDVVGAATVRCCVRLYGRPTRPDVLNVGTRVQTIGATTASTDGVSVTPGNNVVGTYSASLGTLTSPAWWWQLGLGSADTSMTAQIYRFDIAHDATAKYICSQGIVYHIPTTTGELSGKAAFGEREPIRAAPSGTDVYVRGHAAATPDTGFTTVVYALS
jgi:hypothetical protein